VGGSDEIKIALIGCGGRGEGAVQQALETKGPVKLWAVADAFPDRVERCLAGAQQLCERGKRDNNELLKDSTVDVPKERQFVGLDAYQHCIDAGADLILLATPPGFRPQHFEAAVKAGKHIFAEKPIAVDAPGVRRFMAANDEAKKQGLMVASHRPAAASRSAVHRRGEADQGRGDRRHHLHARLLERRRVVDAVEGRVRTTVRPQAERDGVPGAQLVLLQLAVRRPHRRAR
jgi:predicted dehydrogenase